MFCYKCGAQNVAGETFCKNCGYKLNNVTNNQTHINDAQQSMQQQSTVDNFQSNTPNGCLDPKYVEKTVNPNMKKLVILSIIIPVVGIIWYWFIGLSFYMALFIAIVGFAFAQESGISNKKLSIFGKILNGMLGAMALIMLILYIINSATS